jgi:hypothetical protein
MADERQDERACAIARVAFTALFRKPEQRSAQETLALKVALGKREQEA